MPAPPLLRQQRGYFRWYQCFRVGDAVAFPIVGALASQSSDGPEQVRGCSLTSSLGSGVGPRGAGLARFPAWEGLNGPLVSLSPLSRVPSLSFTLLA